MVISQKPLCSLNLYNAFASCIEHSTCIMLTCVVNVSTKLRVYSRTSLIRPSHLPAPLSTGQHSNQGFIWAKTFGGETEMQIKLTLIMCLKSFPSNTIDYEFSLNSVTFWGGGGTHPAGLYADKPLPMLTGRSIPTKIDQSSKTGMGHHIIFNNS